MNSNVAFVREIFESGNIAGKIGTVKPIVTGIVTPIGVIFHAVGLAQPTYTATIAYCNYLFLYK
jgi:hypothetical protein